MVRSTHYETKLFLYMCMYMYSPFTIFNIRLLLEGMDVISTKFRN